MKKIKSLCSATLAAVALFMGAHSAVAGITTVSPGYEEWRWVLSNPNEPEWNNALGKWADGTDISCGDSTISFARLDALREAGGYLDGFTRYADEGKLTLTGYTLDATGDFNYDGNGGTDGGYPIENRYDRWKCAYFKVQGKISVPTAGKWTFCIAASDMTLLSLSLSRSGTSAFNEEIAPGWYNGHVLRVIDLEQGEYDLEFRQFTDNEKVYYEISAAPGEQSSFSSSTFELITPPQTIYTVTFDANGGSFVSPQEIVGGRSVPRPDDPVRDGYAFQFWTLDPTAATPVPYDFSSIVEDDLTLTAIWIENNCPVIESVSSSPNNVTFSGSTATFTLSASAYDADAGDTLTYTWSLVGDPPAGYSIADASLATTDVTVYGPGTFTFKLTVSDGHEAAESTIAVEVKMAANATTFSFAGAEYTENNHWLPDGANMFDHSDPNYGWEFAKAAWRSTGTSAKTYLLDAKRENAYGLDGYVFPGTSAVQDGTTSFNVSSGTAHFDESESVNTLVFSNVTEYVRTFEFEPYVTRGYKTGTFCELNTDAAAFAIDDPREPVAQSVSLFRPGTVALKIPPEQKEDYIPFARMTFSGKVARHAKIRIGILASSSNNFKPKYISVGSAVAEWGGVRNSQDRMPDILFFDIENAKGGETVILSVKQPDNSWNTAILNAVIFDSTSRVPGFAVIIR